MYVALFALMVSLLFVHEMDAVRTKEWKMLILLKDMSYEKAYRIFTALHVPLYFVVAAVMIANDVSTGNVFTYALGCFLIAHAAIRFLFRRKADNGFTSLFSKAIIYSLGTLAAIYLCLVVTGTM